MALVPGICLGRYEVIAPLGAGGMGEVFRARDTRLGRDVALKVLPDRFSSDRHMLARFETEARAVAALSHPNILALFDVGEENGISFAVTELLEGETLRALVARGPVPVKRALEIAREVAEGLAAAHAKGIAHRDIKPENVFLTRDGQVKVLDFGLARHETAFRAADDTHSPTLSALTDAGTVVGTVAYMSPEQARGLPVDHRSDQFSLGAVLYEMLAGKRAFRADTPADVLTAIIRDEPEPLEQKAPHVPSPARWLVERLLSKEPSERWDSTRDLARELATCREHLSEAISSSGGGVLAAPSARGGLRMALPALFVALALATAVLAALYARERQRPHAQPPARFDVRLPEGHFVHPYDRGISLSPDGKLLAYTDVVRNSSGDLADGRSLMLRALDSLETWPIPGTTSAAAGDPIFSPDGSEIAFTDRVDGKPVLRAVLVSGGAVRTVCKCVAAFGAVWSPDGSIVFGSSKGPLRRVPAAGGTPEPATTLDGAAMEVSHRLPSLLPDGHTVVYTALRWTTGGMTWRKSRIYAQRLGAKERHLLVEGGSDGRWAPPGVLLFAREGKLLAAPLDLAGLRLTGPPTPVLEGVRHVIRAGYTARELGVAQYATTRGGLLAWVPGAVDPPYVSARTWFDVSGKETVLQETKDAGPILSSDVSPDGRQVLLSYRYPGMQAEVVDLVRGGRRQVTHDVNPSLAIWGPGPDRITFRSDHEGPMVLYTRRPGAPPGELQTLWKATDGSPLFPGSWSHDGKVLALVRIPFDGNADIWLLEPGKEPRPFAATNLPEYSVDVSPDGKWLLYTVGHGHTAQVFVKALSGEGDVLQVSVSPGSGEPRWSRDGTEIYFWTHVGKPGSRKALFRVKVARQGGTLDLGTPGKLFEGVFDEAYPGHAWDVGPDGRFLLGTRAPEQEKKRWDALLASRIVVDTGGVAHLLAVARPGT